MLYEVITDREAADPDIDRRPVAVRSYNVVPVIGALSDQSATGGWSLDRRGSASRTEETERLLDGHLLDVCAGSHIDGASGDKADCLANKPGRTGLITVVVHPED